eukprot:m51a1_g2284 putative beta-hexosaminidase 3-like (916) ;mRNA; f:394744-398356
MIITLRPAAVPLALLLLALAAAPAVARRAPPPRPTSLDEAMAMPHADLARLVVGLLGSPADPSSADDPHEYWWFFPNTDCILADLPTGCHGERGGMSVEECKSACRKTDGCAGFSHPRGVLQTPKCINTRKASPASDLFILSDRPQPANLAWPPVWPMPRSYANGSVEVPVDVTSWRWPQPASQDLAEAYKRFQQLLFPHPSGGAASSPALSGVEVYVSDLQADLQPGVDESYTLDVPSDGYHATIKTGTIYGVYNALQTLSQLVAFDFATETYSVPGCPWHIEDNPRFTHRELLIDTSRHFQPIPVIKSVIDGMSYTKINVLHWHIVDKESFPFVPPSLPELGLLGSYSETERYTATEVASVIEYARQRGVRVMIEIDVPGHAESWCHADRSICPSETCTQPLNVAHERTFEVIKGLLSDITNLSRDQMLHLGGDEVDTSCWTKTAEIKQWLADHEMNAEQGYEYFVNRAHETAHGLGRDVVGWEEIWNHFGTRLAKGTIIHQWLAGSTIAANATAHGYRVLWSTSSVWYLDWLDVTWQSMYSAEPCEGIPDEHCAALVLGGGGEMWGETVDASDIMSTVFPRLAAIAERLWSPPRAMLSKDEASLFDRGIRLWGASAQTKLRSSTAAVVGMSVLGAEVVKNLALAGVQRITMIDDASVTQRDCAAHLFISPGESLGLNRAEASLARAKAINTLVAVEAHAGSFASMPREWPQGSDVVVACSQPSVNIAELSHRCRSARVPLVVANSSGLRAWLVSDLGDDFPFGDAPGGDKEPAAKRPRAEHANKFVPVHEALAAPLGSFTKRSPAPVVAAAALFQHAISGSSQPFGEWLSEHLSVEQLRNDVLVIKRTEGIEMAAVCAVVAGFASQEAIKSLTRGCQTDPKTRAPPPIVNSLAYDAETCVGDSFYLPGASSN